MPISVTPIRSGRPDYSQVVEKVSVPIPQKPVVGTTSSIYWNTFVNVPPNTIVYFDPTDPFQKPFPHEGKVFRVKKVVVSIEADTLIGVDLADSWPPYTDAYFFASERGYQRVSIEPEAYSIRYPDRFRVFLSNYDTENTRTFFIYIIGVEDVL